MATYPSIVPDTTTGTEAATALNIVGVSSQVAVKKISAIANVATEVGYFSTDTIVYAITEQQYYKYSGTEWVVYVLQHTVKLLDDSAVADASNVGTLRYRVSGNNSYLDISMQTGAETFAWINIVQNNW